MELMKIILRVRDCAFNMLSCTFYMEDERIKAYERDV